MWCYEVLLVSLLSQLCCMETFPSSYKYTWFEVSGFCRISQRASVLFHLFLPQWCSLKLLSILSSSSIQSLAMTVLGHAPLQTSEVVCLCCKPKNVLKGMYEMCRLHYAKCFRALSRRTLPIDVPISKQGSSGLPQPISIWNYLLINVCKVIYKLVITVVLTFTFPHCYWLWALLHVLISHMNFLSFA